MKILEKLKRQPPSADVLQEKLTAALEAQHQAENDYRTACLAAADGGATEQKARTEAEKHLERTKREARELRSAIKAAKAYETQAAEKAADDERTQRWATVREHVDTREKAARDGEAAIAKLADALDRIAEANTAILNAAPQRPDRVGALLGAWDIEGALRMHLLKAGFRWASTWPWGPDSIPSFTKRMADADAYIRRIADENEKGEGSASKATAEA